MLRNTMTSLIAALTCAASVQAAVTISSTSISTPGLPGYRTWTVTATSTDPITAVDFVGDGNNNPATGRGFFGTMNQVGLPTGPTATVFEDGNVLIPLLGIPAGSQVSHDSQFKVNTGSVVVPPGLAEESTSLLQAAWAWATPQGLSVPIAQIVIPAAGASVSYRGAITALVNGVQTDFPVGGVSQPPIPPLVVDANLGDRTQGSIINHTFTASGGDMPITWSDLMVSGTGTPALPPTLTSGGMFTWDSTGSPLGLYNFDVTATNFGGSDVGRLSLNLVAPTVLPPTVIDASLVGAPGDMFMHTFQATGDPPFVWSNLESIGPVAPVIAPTLSVDGKFAWNSTGSNAPLYRFRATATNVAGIDTGQLVIDLTFIPEPATLAQMAIACAALLPKLRRRKQAP